jgi:baculoviral IAP repeat-containing protein 6
MKFVSFQRHFRQLREELGKLKTPKGLEDIADPAFQLASSAPASAVQSVLDSKDMSPVVSSSSQGCGSFGAAGGLNNSQEQSVEENVHHDIDTDIEMEKMVSKVCE